MQPLGPTVIPPFDLRGNVVLERFELSIALSGLPPIHKWISRTLRSITSPMFNEFVIWVTNESFPLDLARADGWKVMDTVVLNALAERNPDFRVVFRVGFPSFYGGRPSDYPGTSLFIANYLPLTSAKGLVKIERVPRVENRFAKLNLRKYPY